MAGMGGPFAPEKSGVAGDAVGADYSIMNRTDLFFLLSILFLVLTEKRLRQVYFFLHVHLLKLAEN